MNTIQDILFMSFIFIMALFSKPGKNNNQAKDRPDKTSKEKNPTEVIRVNKTFDQQGKLMKSDSVLTFYYSSNNALFQ
jgi:hypothetical protein